jgi:hypothetical protein
MAIIEKPTPPTLSEVAANPGLVKTFIQNVTVLQSKEDLTKVLTGLADSSRLVLIGRTYNRDSFKPVLAFAVKALDSDYLFEASFYEVRLEWAADTMLEFLKPRSNGTREWA